MKITVDVYVRNTTNAINGYAMLVPFINDDYDNVSLRNYDCGSGVIHNLTATLEHDSFDFDTLTDLGFVSDADDC